MFIQYVSRKCVRPIVSSLYLLFSGVGCAPDLEIETIIPGMLIVAVTTESIQADREAIAEKESQAASAEGEKSETEESQLANEATIDHPV